MASRGEHWLIAQQKLTEIERAHPGLDELPLALQVEITAIHAQLAAADNDVIDAAEEIYKLRKQAQGR